MSRRFGPVSSTALSTAAATAIVLLSCTEVPARAQEGAPQGKPPAAAVEQIDNPQVFNLWLDPENYPRIERAVNVMNARTTRARALNFLVDHRASEAFQRNALQRRARLRLSVRSRSGSPCATAFWTTWKWARSA
jgi:hypothetical protein